MHLELAEIQPWMGGWVEELQGLFLQHGLGVPGKANTVSQINAQGLDQPLEGLWTPRCSNEFHRWDLYEGFAGCHHHCWCISRLLFPSSEKCKTLSATFDSEGPQKPVLEKCPSVLAGIHSLFSTPVGWHWAEHTLLWPCAVVLVFARVKTTWFEFVGAERPGDPFFPVPPPPAFMLSMGLISS